MHKLARDVLSGIDAFTVRDPGAAPEAGAAPEIVWESPAMGRVLDLVRRVSARPATVLLMGETGTGKSMLAEAIRRDSPRRAQAFIAQNCGALPEALCESELFGYRRGAFSGAVQDRQGLFEAVDGGTIFLDEVSELGPAMQVKLLQVLQDGSFRRVGDTKNRRVDVRIISATNKDLGAEVAAGRFRADLYYRLNVVPILIPPLRARREDIPVLAQYFLDKHRERLNPTVTTILPEAMQALCAYDYPGNVRELENLIERALCLCTGPALELGSWVLGADPIFMHQAPSVHGASCDEDAFTRAANRARSSGAVVPLRRPGRCRTGVPGAAGPGVDPSSLPTAT